MVLETSRQQELDFIVDSYNFPSRTKEQIRAQVAVLMHDLRIFGFWRILKVNTTFFNHYIHLGKYSSDLPQFYIKYNKKIIKNYWLNPMLMP